MAWGRAIGETMPHRASAEVALISPLIEHTPFIECCASQRWVELMRAGAPYTSAEELLAASDRAFDVLTPRDWGQAFAAHARIGESRPGDERGAAEQSGAAGAGAGTLAALRDGNAEYEARFGRVFLIRASGLSAEEMLAALRERLANPPDVELRIAAEQQRQITDLRLRELAR